VCIDLIFSTLRLMLFLELHKKCSFFFLLICIIQAKINVSFEARTTEQSPLAENSQLVKSIKESAPTRPRHHFHRINEMNCFHASVILLMLASLCSCGQSEVERLQDRVDELETENSELQSRIEELESDLAECQGDYSDAQDAIDKARSAIDDLRTQRLIDGNAYSSHGFMQDMEIDDIENTLDY